MYGSLGAPTVKRRGELRLQRTGTGSSNFESRDRLWPRTAKPEFIVHARGRPMGTPAFA
jgi:hypothetical protein